MDGSQKIPQRWLETLEANRREGRECPAIISAIKAWFKHLRGANGSLDDPLAAALTALSQDADDADLAVSLFTGEGPLAGTWNIDNDELSALFGQTLQLG